MTVNNRFLIIKKQVSFPFLPSNLTQFISQLYCVVRGCLSLQNVFFFPGLKLQTNNNKKANYLKQHVISSDIIVLVQWEQSQVKIHQRLVDGWKLLTLLSSSFFLMYLKSKQAILCKDGRTSAGLLRRALHDLRPGVQEMRNIYIKLASFFHDI